MYCKECGKQIPEDSKYCPFCGTNLADVTPMVPKHFDETKTHIDQHRLFGTCDHNHSETAKTPLQKIVGEENLVPKHIAIITKIALAFAIVCMVLSMFMPIVSNVIKSTSKAYWLKITLVIITGICCVISAGMNFSLIFLKSKTPLLKTKQYQRFDIGLRIFYFVLSLATGIILFICANGYIQTPTLSDKKEFYYIAPSVTCMTTLIFSGAMIGINSMILNLDKKMKIISKIKY